MGRCWWPAALTMLALASARNSTTRRLGCGRQRAAWPLNTTYTRRRCCRMGRCWWLGASHGSGVLEAAELYDPAIGMWTLTDPMLTRRSGHTATLLSNGQVL